MKRRIIPSLAAVALVLVLSPAFHLIASAAEQSGTATPEAAQPPPAPAPAPMKRGYGMMPGKGMMRGPMAGMCCCPWMSLPEMGMAPQMGMGMGMMPTDAKSRGQMMQLRGRMMKEMGEWMEKRGKEIEAGQ